MGKFDTFITAGDTRVPVEKRLIFLLSRGRSALCESRGGERNYTGSGFFRSRFHIIDDFTSHSDTLPTRTDANWLIFCEETAVDLFSYNTLSRFSLETFLFKFSCPSEGVSERLVKWSIIEQRSWHSSATGIVHNSWGESTWEISRRVSVVRNFVESHYSLVRLKPGNIELCSTLRVAFFVFRAGALQHRIKLHQWPD